MKESISRESRLLSLIEIDTVYCWYASFCKHKKIGLNRNKQWYIILYTGILIHQTDDRFALYMSMKLIDKISPACRWAF
jgi:hypothetical protein